MDESNKLVFRLGEVKDGRGLKQLISDTVAPPSSDRLIGGFILIKKEPKIKNVKLRN